MTEKVRRRRQNAILLSWASGILGIILFLFVGLSLTKSSEWLWLSQWVFLLGTGLMFAGFFGGLAAVRFLEAERIEGDFIRIRGVCEEYLAVLPEWNL